jgi:hypothetical protein
MWYHRDAGYAYGWLCWSGYSSKDQALKGLCCWHLGCFCCGILMFGVHAADITVQGWIFFSRSSQHQAVQDVQGFAGLMTCCGLCLKVGMRSNPPNPYAGVVSPAGFETCALHNAQSLHQVTIHECRIHHLARVGALQTSLIALLPYTCSAVSMSMWGWPAGCLLQCWPAATLCMRSRLCCHIALLFASSHLIGEPAATLSLPGQGEKPLMSHCSM